MPSSRCCFYLLRSRSGTKTQGVGQGGLPAVVIAAVYAILRPDDTTVVAHWLGVDRGADLIGYVLIVAFIFTTMSTYMRFRISNSNCMPDWPAGGTAERAATRHPNESARALQQNAILYASGITTTYATTPPATR